MPDSTDGDDRTDIPSILSSWLTSVRSVADQYDHHATKRAVDQVPMEEGERRAAHHLFCQHEDTIRAICRHAHRKAQRSPQAPPVSAEDVYQASWELFLRCLVGYDPKTAPLETYLQHALRSRVTDWLRSVSGERVQRPRSDFAASSNPQTGSQVDTSAAPDFDLPQIVRDLVL